MNENLIYLLTSISIISVATERVVEVLKPILPKPNPAYATTMYSSLAFLVSSIIIYYNDISIPIFSGDLPIQILVLGFACTGSAGVWNDLLKAVQLLKVKMPG